MTLLVQDMLDTLTTAGEIGGASGWTGYAGILPDDPDQAIALFESPGDEPDQDTVTPIYEHPVIQIRVRGQEFGGDAVLTKIQSVVSELETNSPSRFIYLWARDGGPFFLRLDRNNRPEYAWNMISMSQIG